MPLTLPAQHAASSNERVASDVFGLVGTVYQFRHASLQEFLQRGQGDDSTKRAETDANKNDGQEPALQVVPEG